MWSGWSRTNFWRFQPNNCIGNLFDLLHSENEADNQETYEIILKLNNSRKFLEAKTDTYLVKQKNMRTCQMRKILWLNFLRGQVSADIVEEADDQTKVLWIIIKNEENCTNNLEEPVELMIIYAEIQNHCKKLV